MPVLLSMQCVLSSFRTGNPVTAPFYRMKVCDHPVCFLAPGAKKHTPGIQPTPFAHMCMSVQCNSLQWCRPPSRQASAVTTVLHWHASSVLCNTSMDALQLGLEHACTTNRRSQSKLMLLCLLHTSSSCITWLLIRSASPVGSWSTDPFSTH